MDHYIDFVVAGSHGCGRVQTPLMESLAEEIFRPAYVAVFTVGPAVNAGVQSEIAFNRILFATDFSKQEQTGGTRSPPFGQHPPFLWSSLLATKAANWYLRVLAEYVLNMFTCAQRSRVRRANGQR